MRTAAPARKKVALVDDDADFRKLVMRWLGARYEARGFAAGEELLASGAQTPDLVVLDARMPGLDGFRLCERLRADPRFAEVPVLLLTAVDTEESFLRGFEAGADAYLAKPVERLSLLEKVAELLEKPRRDLSRA